MNVKRLFFSLLMLLIAFESHSALVDSSYTAIDSSFVESKEKHKYDKKIEQYQKKWMSFIPNKTSIQYAGDIGFLSVGIGWDYGKCNNWETYILLGYVPKNESRRHYFTFTLKELYSPWNIHCNNKVSIRPIYVTLMANTIFNEEFWVKEPDRYPIGYYEFSSKIRLHLGLGQKIALNISESRRRWHKEIAFYYELSTCELYLRQKIINKDISIKDILCIGVGLQFTLF